MRKRLLLIALAIIALGLIGTSLSTLYERSGAEFLGTNFPYGPWKTSYGYGFPISWYGYSFISIVVGQARLGPVAAPPNVYWFSLVSLLLDVAFWFGISFFVSVAAMKSVNILLKRTASKSIATYFLGSASFSILGLSAWLFSYEDLGWRLFGFGIFLVAATFYQTLVIERKTFQTYCPRIS
jgi:hypothetical protein